MKAERRKAYIALAWVSFFWGTTYLASKISAHAIPGLFVSGVRQTVSGLILVAYFKSIGYQWPDKKSWGIIAVQGFFLLCIANGLLTWSMEYIDSGLGAIIAGLVPLFVALFSILLLRFARFTPLMILGLVIGFGGIVTIFYEHFSQLLNSKYAFGVGLSLAATVSWSFGTVYASRYKPKTNLLFGVGLQMLLAGVVILLVCGVSGKYTNLLQAESKALWSLLYLIIVGSLLSYSAYVFAVSKLPPTQVSVYAYINPIVAIFLGWLILKEHMSLNVITGTLVTLGGVWLVNKEFKKQQVTKVQTQENNEADEALVLSMANGTKDAHVNNIEIISYKAEHAYHFERLNKAWIEKYFYLEEMDKWVLENPHEAILAKGGTILMATCNGAVAGTVALIKVSDHEYEFAKMAVDEAFQRRGIAEALSHAALKKAREMGAKKVSLYSQTSLAAAISLYRKLGFAEVPMDHVLYKRANIKMEMLLHAKEEASEEQESFQQMPSIVECGA